MTNSPPAPPKPAIVPTSSPLAPQVQTPEQVKSALADAAARHAETAAALAAAQNAFDEADRRRQYALSEEEKRRALEQEARVNELRRVLPQTEDDATRFQRLFREACAEEPIDMSRVLEAFTYWGRYREVAARMRSEVLRHDSQQSRDDYELWMRRISGWSDVIRSVTSWRKGGTLAGEDDDLEGLAKVNARINEESQSAPRPLNREAADLSTPFIEDMGLRDPLVASIDGVIAQPVLALEFGTEFSAAVAAAASSWARNALSSLSSSRGKEDNR